MTDRPTTETTICYAVLIRRKDGTEFFGNGRGAARALLFKPADAVAHADMHAKACGWPRRKMRVVKVESVIREVVK